LAECPKCGTEVASPLKTWSMVGRPSKTGERFKLTLGLFKCPMCERRFRAVIGKERITIKGIVKEIKGIEKELMQTLGSLREKIGKLENEKADLLEEIEKLRKVGEEKATALETEVATLRKEVESLKELLGDFE
jgi:DNA repair exonuclease SbcCD ATPase subunit